MSYQSEVKLLAVWLVLALLAALVLMVVLLVRQPPEPEDFWRTVRLYFLLSCLLCTFLPVILLVVRTAYAMYEWGGPTLIGYWWVPLLVVGLVVLVGAGVWLYRWEHPEPELEGQEITAVPQIVVQPMWSAPTSAQWNASDSPVR